MKKAFILPCSMALIISAQAETYQQETTVVTASRYEQAKDDVVPSVTVITREDILNIQANSILDVLTLQQGIDVARTGGAGSSTSVFMRGTNSNHSLVLIDGVKVESSYSGTFAWEHLPVSQIERIEIVRGSRVSYYGADAIGGVINIITRKQENLYARYTAGSYDSQSLDIGYGQSFDKGHYSLILGGKKTDGFSATNENNEFAYNPDDDGYDNYSLNFSSSIKVGSGDIKFNYLEFHGDVDFDSYFDLGHSENEDRVIKLAWNSIIFNDWHNDLSVANNSGSILTKAFSSKNTSDRYTFDWLLNKDFGNNHLGFGINYQKEESKRDNLLLNSFDFESSRNNSAAFVNWQGQFSNNVLTVSSRYDNNSVYGSDVTGDLGWAYEFNDKIRFNLSAGTAFNAPNLTDLFSVFGQTLVYSPELDDFVGFFSYEGNPDLKPEESTNYEMGLNTKISDDQDLSVNVFYYQIDNLVDYEGSRFKPVNVMESNIKGMELDYNLRKGSINFNANATIQDAVNEDTDMPLLRRPDNKINLSLDKYFNKFSMGTSVRYASKSHDFDAQLDSYTVIDLRAAYKLNDNWRLALKVENAADEDYQIVHGYNTPGSSGYFTIEWQAK
jgi:vitamin B12 transporter